MSSVGHTWSLSVHFSPKILPQQISYYSIDHHPPPILSQTLNGTGVFTYIHLPKGLPSLVGKLITSPIRII